MSSLLTRRSWLTAGGVAAAGLWRGDPVQADDDLHATYDQLDRVLAEPVLNLADSRFPDALVIDRMELLRHGRAFLVRVRTTDGAEGLAVPNASRLTDTYPVFLNRIAPFFEGKDARNLESLLTDLYRDRSNYKLQGIALWANVAAAEFAVLDLLGRVSGQSIGQLLGGIRRSEISVYRASGNRGNTPEEEVDYLRRLVAETGAGAVKFRVGGRMSDNRDSLPGRSEALIPLVREALGPEMTLYADSNSSYDAANAIRLGRMMEEHDYGFFEEPCRFDHLEEAKQVADALTIPVAGGEQEFSMRRFRWMIADRAVDVVQPDLHYFGGYLRCLRVARMADVAGMPCTLHMSGSGLGFLDVVHFASVVSDPGPHQEYKGPSGIPFTCETSTLECKGGMIRVPTGPGFGVTIDPEFVREAEVATTI